MRFSITLLFVFFGLYLFQSCDSQKTVIKNVPSDKLNNTYTIGMNDTLTIELKSNPTTGYVWSIDNKIKPKVIQELNHEFVKNNKTTDMVGAGGFDYWKFLPLKTGEVYLHFIYMREDGKIDKEKYYKVAVE